MYEITCFDSDGNSIDYFNQWDINQTITIKLHGCDDDYLKNPPMVFFSNKNSKEARKVRSTVKEDNLIVSQVPNILLQEPYPLFISVYLTDSNNDISQKTILSDEIIVRKQPKPSDYYYVENITQITAQQIKREIKSELVDDINKSSMRFDGVTLWDIDGQRPYELYVSDGKLMLGAFEENEHQSKQSVNCITFVDDANGKEDYYKIYVSNGKLYLDEVY